MPASVMVCQRVVLVTKGPPLLTLQGTGRV